MKSAVIIFLASTTVVANAQERIDLKSAFALAAAADPRVAQLQLEAEQTELRLQTIENERRRPSLTVEGQAQYQSQVVEIPFNVPGRAAPKAPKDTLDGYVRFEQPLLDPTREARIAAERARLAEAQQRVRVASYGLRQEVNDAFFAAALLQEKEAQLATVLTDLEARLGETRVRVQERTALPGDAAAIEATLLQRREELAELRANRRGALARLSELTGQTLTLDDALVLPELASTFARAKGDVATLRERPEFAQFARGRERLEAQKATIAANEKPFVSAYGRAGIGKPGYNFLDNEFNPYFIAGVRVQWKPWDWGARERERRAIELQQESLDADEAALARAFERAIQNDLAAVERLTGIHETDDRIVALRELIEHETAVRFDEQVVTAAEYVDKQTDVLEARLLRATHRVELAQAQARILTILGVEIQ
ncbi:MAG TPA: TolC family protein [Thermoanaerobaculia bacterium]|nr:TolC family protein [Thermoanaerobaculia bacterium]